MKLSRWLSLFAGFMAGFLAFFSKIFQKKRAKIDPLHFETSHIPKVILRTKMIPASQKSFAHKQKEMDYGPIISWGFGVVMTMMLMLALDQDRIFFNNVLTAQQGSEIVRIAQSFNGAPYTWGAAVPCNPTTGCDCSSFTATVVQKALGVNLPRVSKQQAQVGQKIDKIADLQLGDLVFFDTGGAAGTTPKSVSHVGIVTASSGGVVTMWNAQSANPSAVVAAKVSSKYWSSAFLWGSRINSVTKNQKIETAKPIEKFAPNIEKLPPSEPGTTPPVAPVNTLSANLNTVAPVTPPVSTPAPIKVAPAPVDPATPIKENPASPQNEVKPTVTNSTTIPTQQNPVIPVQKPAPVNPNTPSVTPAIAPAVPAPTPEPVAFLADVGTAEPFYNAVKWAADKGIVNGAGKFNPFYSLSRAEMAKFICKSGAVNCSSTAGGKEFPDVASHWSRVYAKALSAKGIVNGYEDGNFGPDDLLTSEQASVIAARAFGLQESWGDCYSDVPRDHWFATNWCGTFYSDKLFPSEGYKMGFGKKITRAKAIHLIFNIAKKTGKS